jgi:hypothetical protein
MGNGKIGTRAELDFEEVINVSVLFLRSDWIINIRP